MSDHHTFRSQPDPLLVLLPLLIILSTFLFLLLSFLICAVILRRRRGIILRDNDGPVDMSREELVESDGGFANIESRWLEESNENLRRAYLRAKGALFFCTAPHWSLICVHTQSIKYNTRQTLNQPTLPSPSFSQYRKKACLHGLLNQTSKPSIRCLSTPGRRSPSYRTQLLRPVSNPICLFQN